MTYRNTKPHFGGYIANWPVVHIVHLDILTPRAPYAAAFDIMRPVG